MKRILSIAAAVALTATSSFAQVTSQENVLGASGNPAYPLEVQGANGVIYNCENEIVMIDGVNARRCVREGQGGLFANGSGMAAGGAAAAGILLLAVLLDDDDNNSTTTTP